MKLLCWFAVSELAAARDFLGGVSTAEYFVGAAHPVGDALAPVPINPEAWRWYRDALGDNRTPVVDTWWQTETGR
jgi:hypothetical protein